MVNVEIPEDMTELLPKALVSEIRELREENAELKREMRRIHMAVLTDKVLMEIVEGQIKEFGYKVDRSNPKRYTLVPMDGNEGGEKDAR